MASDGAQAELGVGDDGIHLRLLDSTDQFVVMLRRCSRGQGGLELTGGEGFPGIGFTRGSGSGRNSGACKAKAEGSRLGVGPAHGMELLRRLWRAVVWWSGGSTAAQGICSDAEGVAVVLELGNGGYGEDRAQWRAAGANQRKPGYLGRSCPAWTQRQ